MKLKLRGLKAWLRWGPIGSSILISFRVIPGSGSSDGVPLVESLVESFWGRAVLAKHSNHLEAGREGYLAARKLDHLYSQAQISPQHDRWQAEGTACRGFMLNNQSAAQSWGEVFLMGDTLQKLDGYQEWTNAVSQG
ncbi:unnamed protein product [Arctogadus glacialis]